MDFNSPNDLTESTHTVISYINKHFSLNAKLCVILISVNKIISYRLIQLLPDAFLQNYLLISALALLYTKRIVYVAKNQIGLFKKTK